MSPPAPPTLTEEAAGLVREAADALPVLISYVDAEERYRFVNRAYTEWFGGERADFIGRTLREVLGEVAYLAVQPQVQAALRGETVRFETRAAYRTGVARDIDASYAPRRGQDGAVIGFYVLVQDVTARTAAETERARSEARLAGVLESMSDGFHAIDRDWRFTIFNRASETFYGLSRDMVLGRSIWEVFPQMRGSAFEPMLLSAMNGETPLPVEATPIGAPGRRILARTSPAPDGVTVTFTDITERWLAEQALRKSEIAAREQLEELQAIYEASPIGLAFLTDDLRFLRVNRRLASMNGLSAEAHGGRTVREVVPAIADQIDAIKTRLDAGEPIVSYEVCGETPASPGEERYWAEYWTPVRNTEGALRGLAVAVEDITERKTAEAQTRLLIDELNHRVKNTLSVVQSIARQTLKGASRKASEALEQRLLALASAHNVLTQSKWTTAALRDVADVALGGEGGRRVRLVGPAVSLSPNVAVSLSLALHELATNARKYGALSTSDGVVDLHWSVKPDRVDLFWRERGGPRVKPPKRPGFGVSLLNRTARSVEGGGVQLEFAPAGVTCHLAFPHAEAERARL